MAAVSAENLSASSDEVLKQMRFFLKGTIQRGRINSEELVQSAIFLLQTVPAARQAVLEYMCQVFEEASAFFKKNEPDKKMDPDQSLKASVYSNVISEIQTVLHNFIKHHPGIWAPIISSWSIELLGQISMKYSDRRHLPNAGNLNELLQLWMSCQPTKVLIEVVSDCFSSMISSTPEVCVDALLEASVKYSSYFDWVVAHIGSCFPKTVINRVLMSGLEEYYQSSQGQLIAPAALELRVPKITSVVGILSHLAGHHSNEIRAALKGLFVESLQPSRPVLYRSAVPFLLQVASLSPVLLRALTINFVDTMTPDILNTLALQYKDHPSKDPRGLVNLIVHLLGLSTDCSYRFIQFLLNLAAPMATSANAMETDDQPKPAVMETSTVIMNGLLMDLHRAVYNSGDSAGVPFLQTLAPHGVILSRELAVTNGKRSIWLSRLLTLLSLHTSENEGANILSTLLISASSPHQLSVLVTMFRELCVKYPDLMESMMAKVIDHLKVRDEGQQTDKVKVVKNLLTLTKQDRSKKDTFVSFPISSCLEKHLLVLSSHLVTSTSQDYRSTVLGLLSTLTLPRMLSADMAISLSSDLVVCLFSSIMLEDTQDKFRICQSCSECIQQLCRSNIVSQTLVLRNLLEGVMSNDLRELFGGKVDKVKVSAPSSLSLRSTLERPSGTPLKEGIQSGARSVIFHAGVIGRGLRPTHRPTAISKEQMDSNKQIFMDTLWACCHGRPVPGENGSVDPSGHQEAGMSPDFARDLALLVIELVAPDVMYNGILWPEEDFMKTTVERDLLIKKQFENNPVLWDVMDLLSQGLGALSYCSVLLRALTAVLVMFWESSRLGTSAEAPWHLEASVKVIELLRKGGLLASPLSHVGELFPMLTPYEVYLLLMSVWKFMKENPPDPRCDRREGCHPIYLDTLRFILQANISRLGHLYLRFFTAKSPS